MKKFIKFFKLLTVVKKLVKNYFFFPLITLEVKKILIMSIVPVQIYFVLFYI